MFLAVPFLYGFDCTCLVLNLIKEQNRMIGVMAATGQPKDYKIGMCCFFTRTEFDHMESILFIDR